MFLPWSLFSLSCPSTPPSFPVCSVWEWELKRCSVVIPRCRSDVWACVKAQQELSGYWRAALCFANWQPCLQACVSLQVHVLVDVAARCMSIRSVLLSHWHPELFMCTGRNPAGSVQILFLEWKVMHSHQSCVIWGSHKFYDNTLLLHWCQKIYKNFFLVFLSPL